MRIYKVPTLTLVSCLTLTACSWGSNERAEMAQQAQVEQTKRTQNKAQSVQCVSKAITALRASEHQGGARYAKQNLETAYNLLNQAIGLMNVADAKTVCSATTLAEKEANMALYIAVNAEAKKGVKRTKPRPIQLNTAQPSKPKYRIIEASYEKKAAKPQAVAPAEADPLLPSSRWSAVTEKDTQIDNMRIKPKEQIIVEMVKKPAHKPEVDKKSLYVEDGVFYRGFKKADKGRVKGLSNGHDVVSEYIRYKVQKDDTLWWIAKNVFADPRLWPAIFESNKQIENPDRIYPGQSLMFRPATVFTANERDRLRNEAIAWDIDRRKNKRL